MTDKTIPALLDQIRLLKEKIAKIVPLDKKAIDLRTDTSVSEIQRKEAEEKAKSAADANKKAQSDIQNHPSFKSHRTGGGDKDPDRGGETGANAGSAGRIKTAGDQITATLRETIDPAADAIEAVAQAVQSLDCAYRVRFALIESQFKNGRLS